MSVVISESYKTEHLKTDSQQNRLLKCHSTTTISFKDALGFVSASIHWNPRDIWLPCRCFRLLVHVYECAAIYNLQHVVGWKEDEIIGFHHPRIFYSLPADSSAHYSSLWLTTLSHSFSFFCSFFWSITLFSFFTPPPPNLLLFSLFCPFFL
jgi:hypothetical protein